MNTIYLLLIIFLCYLLSKTTDLTAHALRTLKNRIRLNEFILAFFFLGVVTSIPEMFVAINSAAKGVPNLSLGNLLGADIVVLTLMLGITALFTGRLSIHGQMLKDDFYRSLFVIGLPILFILDGRVDRWEGFVLIGAFLALVASFYKNRHYYQIRSKPIVEANTSKLKELGIFLFSICALLIISHILVGVTITAASAWGIPLLIIGLLVISIGTNAPELGFVFQQASKMHANNRSIATGVLLGNAVVNTFVLGVLVVIRPFNISDSPTIWATSIFLLITLIALGHFMHSRNKLSRTEGALLMLIYVVFVFYIFSNSPGQIS